MSYVLYVYITRKKCVYVGRVAIKPNIFNISTSFNTYWTAFWSPIRSIRELRTNNSDAILNGCVLRVYVMFSRGENNKP